MHKTFAENKIKYISLHTQLREHTTKGKTFFNSI